MGSYLAYCPAVVFDAVRQIGITVFVALLPFILVFIVLSMFGPTRAIGRWVGRAGALSGGLVAGSAMGRRRSAPRERPVMRVPLDSGPRSLTVTIANVADGVQPGDRLTVWGPRLGRRVRAVRVRNHRTGGRVLDLGFIVTAIVVTALLVTPFTIAATC